MGSSEPALGIAEKDPSAIPTPPVPPPPSELDRKDEEWWRQQRHIEQDWLHRARKKFAPAIFCVLCGWLLAVLAILFLDGFGVRANWLGGTRAFQLPDGVLYALLAATTAGVVGLFAVVAKYLFPVLDRRK